MTPVQLVMELVRFVVAIAAEAAPTEIPACWTIYVADVEGQDWKGVKSAGEPARGELSALRQPMTPNAMDGATQLSFALLGKAHKATSGKRL